MSRKDYEEIKEKFALFVQTWKTREVSLLDDLFFKNVRCYLSTSKKMPNGSQDSIFGVRDFINDFPRTDILHLKIYDFVCKENGKDAQQYAEVHCVALDGLEEEKEVLDSFEFVCLTSVHWKFNGRHWKISCLKMDVAPFHGNLRTKFSGSWYLQDSVGLIDSPRNNCIVGELDAPWYAIDDPNDDLTEIEKVKEVMAKYAYGEDQNVFSYCYDAYSDYYACGGILTSCEKKIEWITSIKNKRMKDRYWMHPFKFIDIQIEGDRAYAIAERPCGHRQRIKEYIWTKDNADIEYSCGKMNLEFKKEKDWKLVYAEYYLGLFQGEQYTSELYGDSV